MSNDDDQGPPVISDSGGDDSAPVAPVAPIAPVPKSNEEIIREWLQLVYLQLAPLGNPLQVTIQEFLDIIVTGSTDNNLDSWLLNNHLDLTTALLTHFAEQPDILVVPSGPATVLANIGLGITDIDYFKEDVLSEQLYKAMKEESVRWVVVPVTDGMADREQARRDKAKAKAAAKAARTKESEETGEQEQQVEIDPVQEHNAMEVEVEPEFRSLNAGTHWGLMVIDKKENDARWLDGHLELQKCNKKWSIKWMSNAGWAAGKILCGYDQVMGLERGRFTAATLKHVPHDTRDNLYKHDQGSACGPWIFAMFAYILENRAFLTDAGGLHSTFRRSKLRLHTKRMAFHSLRTRQNMQEIIRDEAEKGLGEDDLPYKMTVRILKILGFLPNSEDLLRRVARYDPRKRFSPRHHNNGGSGKGPGGDSDGGGDDDGWPDEHKGVPRAAYQVYLGEREPYSSKRLNEAFNAFIQGQRDLENSLRRGKHGVLTQDPIYSFPEGFSWTKLLAFHQLKMGKENPWYSIYQGNLLKVDDKRSLTIQTSRAVLHSVFKGSFKSEGKKILTDYLNDTHAFAFAERSRVWEPKDIAERLDQTYTQLALPLFASLSPAGVDNWVENLYPNAKSVIQKTAGVTQYEIARGLLYRMFIGEFADMTDENVDEWRANDPDMLEAGKQNREVARYWLTWYYYQGDAREKLPYLKASPLHWPPREHREVHGQKRKAQSEEVEDGGDPNPDQPSPNADNTSNIAQPDPKTIQWATVDHATLMKYATREIREDPRIGELSNDYTYRAILFVKHGGKFKDEKAHSEIWVRDLNVFTLGAEDQVPARDVFITGAGGLGIRPTVSNIVQRMRDKYEDTATEPEPAVEETSQPGKSPRGTKGPGKPAKPGKSGKPANPANPANPAKPPKPSGTQSTPPESQQAPQNVPLLGAMLKDDTPDFTSTTKIQVQEWIKMLPDSIADRIRTADIWTQKATLQKLFGDFDVLTRNSKRTWRDKHALFDKDMDPDDVASALKEMTKDVGLLKGSIVFYPRYYLHQFEKDHKAEIEATKTVDEAANKGDANGEDYEDIFAGEPSGSEDDNAAARPAATAKGTKRKGAGDNTSAPANKKRKGEIPEFRTMQEADLLPWVEKLPAEAKASLIDEHGGLLPLREAYARIYLERVFKKTFQTWAAQDTLTEESKKEVKAWRQLGTFSGLYERTDAELKRFCETHLFPRTKTVGAGKKTKKVELPDYSDDKDRWPEDWK
jgi:hypothetical protein